MKKDFLKYYQEELFWVKEMSKEFSLQYPNFAKHLGIEEKTGTSDPYIERLLEGFAFLTAKIQMQIDKKVPKFTKQFLEILHPEILSSFPSCGIAEFIPEFSKSEKVYHKILRGTVLNFRKNNYFQRNCKYQTIYNINMYPIRIEEVSFSKKIPFQVYKNSVYKKNIVDSLKIKIKCTNGYTLKNLKFDKLMFYICGNGIFDTQKIIELIVQNTQFIFFRIAEKKEASYFSEKNNLVHEGFEKNQSLFPNFFGNIESYQILKEYFCFPEKFHFFSIKNIKKILRLGKNFKTIEIFLFFDKSDEKFIKKITKENLFLNCTPVINFFKKDVERIFLEEKKNEYLLVPDKLYPLDYEVHNLQKVYAVCSDGHKREFKTFYKKDYSEIEKEFWFSLKKKKKIINKSEDRKDFHASNELDTFISITQKKNPFFIKDKYQYLDVIANCSNKKSLIRYLKKKNSFLSSEDLYFIKKINILSDLSDPILFDLDEKNFWNLINFLQIRNYDIFLNKNITKEIKNILIFYQNHNSSTLNMQISGIKKCYVKKTYRLSNNFPPTYISGYKIFITVDENLFPEKNAWLFGSIIASFFSKLKNINTFTETILVSLQRGEIGIWKN